MSTPPKVEPPPRTVQVNSNPSIGVEDALAPPSVAGSLHATPSDTFQRSFHKPQVPGFDILAEIGHGGMGVVFKARQASLDRIVALKMVLAGEFAQPIALQRFLTEAKVIARIDHPGIIRVHEFGHHQGLPYFALDYLPGGSLADQLEGRPQEPRQAAAMVAKLAQAMQAAHDQGIIHRDLKPANVLLTLTGEPKITDFGLAKQHDSQLTATGVALGTPSYMSPEQAQGRREVGPLSDVYALGAILYEMLTGRPPFLGVTPLETMARVMKEEPVPPLHLQPGTPEDLNTICLKCLEKDPLRRYESAAALGADLQRFLKGEPILARSAGRVERGIKWMKRNPALTGLLATGTLAIIALSIAVFWLVQAKGEETAARQEAEQKALQAKKAQQEAEENFHEARKTVDQLFVAVTETDMLQQESLQPVRKLLLGYALPFYEDSRSASGDNKEAITEAALALFRVARITEEIGSASDATARYQKAAALYAKVLTTQPNDSDSQTQLSEVWNHLGLLQNKMGQKQDAAHSFQQAMALREKLSITQPDNLDNQQALARLWHNLGLMNSALDKRQEAERCYRKALGLYEKLTVREPDEVKHRAELSHVWTTLGELQHEMGQHPEAIRSLQQGLPLQEKLAADLPRLADYQEWLARTWTGLGNAQKSAKQFAEATRSFQQALAIQDKLAADFPNVVRHQAASASLHASLATLQADTGKHGEAEQSFGQAIKAYEKLVAAHPRVVEYRLELGEVFLSRGKLERTRSTLVGALPWFSKAVEVLNAAWKQEPGNAVVKKQLRLAYASRAIAYDHLANFTASAQDWDQAAALHPEPQEEAGILAGQAMALAKSGHHVRAAELAKEGLRRYGPLPQVLYGVARIYALCFAAVPTPSPLRAHYANQAVECLKQAHAKGHFRGPRRLENFDKEPDFAALRTHPAYQAWRRTLPGGK